MLFMMSLMVFSAGFLAAFSFKRLSCRFMISVSDQADAFFFFLLYVRQG
jgi:hypothetical protein